MRRRDNGDRIIGNAVVLGTEMDPNFVPPSMSLNPPRGQMMAPGARTPEPVSSPPAPPPVASGAQPVAWDALTARAERAEAAEADLRATVERVEALCSLLESELDDASDANEFVHGRSVEHAAITAKLRAALDSTTPPPSPEGERASDWDAECCPGQYIRNSAMLLHSDDCPVYRQNLEAIDEAYRRKRERGCGPECNPATCVHMYDEHFPGEPGLDAPAALDGGQPEEPAPPAEPAIDIYGRPCTVYMAPEGCTDPYRCRVHRGAYPAPAPTEETRNA